MPEVDYILFMALAKDPCEKGHLAFAGSREHSPFDGRYPRFFGLFAFVIDLLLRIRPIAGVVTLCYENTNLAKWNELHLRSLLEHETFHALVGNTLALFHGNIGELQQFTGFLMERVPKKNISVGRT